jgi:hypothetical protein
MSSETQKTLQLAGFCAGLLLGLYFVLALFMIVTGG